MWWRKSLNSIPYDAGNGPFFKWGMGVILPIALFSIGLSCLLTRHGVLVGRGTTSMDVSGLNAIALGVAEISGALLINCIYFWDNIYDDAWPTVLGRIVGLCGFAAGMGTLIVRVMVLG